MYDVHTVHRIANNVASLLLSWKLYVYCSDYIFVLHLNALSKGGCSERPWMYTPNKNGPALLIKVGEVKVRDYWSECGVSSVWAPVMAVLPWHGLWRGLKCVELSGSSERPPVLQSEHDLHLADPQSVASNSHQPKKNTQDVFNGFSLWSQIHNPLISSHCLLVPL